MEKKFILFIVEGKNDKREISAILKSPYFDKYKDKYQIEFRVMNGDITTTKNVTAENIQKHLNEILMDFRRNGVPYSNIKVQDIQEIVQVVDLDGCFIPRGNIISDGDSKFKYTDMNIITTNIDGAAGRNNRKASVLKKLVSINQIGNVPYSVYFVSCNMDHVLFNQRIMNQKNKDRMSFKFSEKCEISTSEIDNSILKEGVRSEDYYDSWEEIQVNCKSLERHTNINLFLTEKAKNVK